MRQTTTTKAKKTIKQAIRVDTAPQKDHLDHYLGLSTETVNPDSVDKASSPDLA